MTQIIETPGEGWEPDPPEGNADDWQATDYLGSVDLPSAVNLESQLPPVLNQSKGGACVLFSWAQAIYQCLAAQGVAAPELEVPGIMRPWWLSRREAGLEDWNVGTYNRRAGRIIRAQGFSRGKHDPYNWRNYQEAPTIMADRMSVDQRRGLKFARLPPRTDNRGDDVRHALANGRVVVMGWKLPKRFKRRDVDWGQPFDVKPGEEMGGGHAMVIFGYLADGSFLVRNSWGLNVHIRGNFRMGEGMVIDGHDPWLVLSAPRYSDRARA